MSTDPGIVSVVDMPTVEQCESESSSAPPVLDGEALMDTCSSALQQDMPGNDCL